MLYGGLTVLHYHVVVKSNGLLSLSLCNLTTNMKPFVLGKNKCLISYVMQILLPPRGLFLYEDGILSAWVFPWQKNDGVRW